MFIFSFALLSLKQSEFCSDKPKSGAKYGLPDSLAILSEMGEVTEGMMDAKVNSNELIQMLLGNPGIYNLHVLKKLKGKVEGESSHLYQCHCGKLGTAVS